MKVRKKFNPCRTFRGNSEQTRADLLWFAQILRSLSNLKQESPISGRLGSAKKVIACVATRVKRDLIVAHSLGHLAQRKDSTIECIKFFMTLRVFI